MGPRGSLGLHRDGELGIGLGVVLFLNLDRDFGHIECLVKVAKVGLVNGVPEVGLGKLHHDLVLREAGERVELEVDIGHKRVRQDAAKVLRDREGFVADVLDVVDIDAGKDVLPELKRLPALVVVLGRADHREEVNNIPRRLVDVLDDVVDLHEAHLADNAVRRLDRELLLDLHLVLDLRDVERLRVDLLAEVVFVAKDLAHDDERVEI